MDENMDLNKQDMNMNENQLNNFMEAVENMDLNKQVFEKDNELESDTEDVLQEFAKPRCSYEKFIGESDAQMLINKMENRKTYVPNFTFQYRVENSELVSMFWADEVAKCNYKEFGDIVSFDATFNSNKQGNAKYRRRGIRDFAKQMKQLLTSETKLPIELHAAHIILGHIICCFQTESIPRDKNPKNNTALNTKKGKEQEKKSGTVAETARDFKEKTNEHTKITCPKNPKARKKKKLTPIIDI
ncbi:hypothetical protein Tco_0211323 [Tanacetum coccineum]